MRIAARLLLILPLALGLYLPASLLTSAQQPGTVNVRPRVTTPQPGIPEVRANVDRNRVPLGQEVTFTLSPARIVSDPRYRVTLYFGDGKRQVMRQAKISHLYPQTGTYTYSILVEAEKQPTPTPTPTSVPTVKLTVNPTAVEVNRPVNFSAQLSRRYPNIKYRFVFADGSDSGWQDSSNATHSYRSPNTYKAYVDIGVYSNGSTKQVGGSEREAIKVTESRSANATVKLSANPSSVDTGKPVTFNARLNPQSANARYRFDFGDRSPATNWQTSSQTTHRYKSAGKYSARVEARQATPNTQTISDSTTIQVSNAADAKPTVDLKVVPGSVLVGLPVFFEAVPSAANANARYRFDFGDGSATTAWSSSRYQTHSYKAAGSYSAFVEMAASGNEPSVASGKKRVRVDAIPTNNTNDNQNNQNGNRNNNQNGNANTNSTRPNNNGNVNAPGNTNTNGNRNANANANANSFGSVNGNVNSNVNANGNLNQNANVNGNRNGNSNGSGNLNANGNLNQNSTPVVPPTGQTEPSNWWKYAILLVILLLGGYQAYSYFFAPRPTFVPHVDVGDATVDADNPLAINMQMDVDPNVANGEFKIDSEGNSLIKSQRTEP